jgi:hypothetical protein
MLGAYIRASPDGKTGVAVQGKEILAPALSGCMSGQK